LTPGPTPPGWHSPGPPCFITNVNGTVSAFVQINGVRLNPIIEEDTSTIFDTINGGTAYPNGVQSDTTVNVYTANSGTCLVVNDTTGGCMHRIHMEIDHDWKAASYCGPNTTCDNSTLHRLTIPPQLTFRGLSSGTTVKQIVLVTISQGGNCTL
jgi:hypothetical protein